MIRKYGPSVVAVSALALTACSLTRAGDLMPANEVAARIGYVQAHFIAHGTGHGEAWVALPDGETLTGGYQLDRDQTIYSNTAAEAMALFGKGAVREAGVEELEDTPTWSPGVVDVSSPSGLSAHCTVVNNNYTPQGSGVCTFSNGALFNLRF